MIGRMRGTIIEKQPPYLVLDVSGIGYEIAAPMTTFYQLPDLNELVTLYTQLIVRQDAHMLYGFYDKQDRHLFRALIKVNGIGPKLALSILSGLESNQFVQCINERDNARLINIPGVGKRTVERLIVEMRDALSHWSLPSSTEANRSHNLSTKMDDNRLQDALRALAALGYKSSYAKRVVNKIYHPKLDSEQMIRLALQYIAKRGL